MMLAAALEGRFRTASIVHTEAPFQRAAESAGDPEMAIVLCLERAPTAAQTALLKRPATVFVIPDAEIGPVRHLAGVLPASNAAAALRERLRPPSKAAQALIVPVEGIDLAVLKMIEYARSLSNSVTAIHVTDDMEQGRRLRNDWDSRVIDVPLVVIDSPFRSFVAPVLSYLDALPAGTGRMVSVMLPEFRTALPGTSWLHNQSVRRLKKALLDRPNTVIIEMPYDLSGTDDAV